MNEETLTFYYYNDGLSQSERQEVVNALATDTTLAGRYRRLCQQLDGLSGQPLHPPPADMVERWHDTIKTAAMRQEIAPPKPVFHTWSFFWGVAITAALAIGIGIGVLLSGRDTATNMQYETYAEDTSQQSAFVRGLQVHFRESEESISRLAIDAGSDNTELLTRIIAQNRLFERAAIQNNDPGTARVLRAFELVLIRIGAEETTTEDAEELRAKLLFELNIMLTKLSRDTSEKPRTI
jgi:hypothetical protein